MFNAPMSPPFHQRFLSTQAPMPRRRHVEILHRFKKDLDLREVLAEAPPPCQEAVVSVDGKVLARFGADGDAPPLESASAFVEGLQHVYGAEAMFVTQTGTADFTEEDRVVT